MGDVMYRCLSFTGVLICAFGLIQNAQAQTVASTGSCPYWIELGNRRAGPNNNYPGKFRRTRVSQLHR